MRSACATLPHAQRCEAREALLDGSYCSCASRSSWKRRQSPEIKGIFSILPSGFKLRPSAACCLEETLQANFSVAMIVAAQGRRDKSRRAIPNRTAINTDNRQHDLTGGGDECFARFVGFLDH